MTEQPPSAEAMTLLSEILGSCGKAGLCRFPPCSCAESIDALIVQRVSAEAERWLHRDRQRLQQIDRLQEAVQGFQSARAERPAPKGPQQQQQSVQERINSGDLRELLSAPSEGAEAPPALASTGEQPAPVWQPKVKKVAEGMFCNCGLSDIKDCKRGDKCKAEPVIYYDTMVAERPAPEGPQVIADHRFEGGGFGGGDQGECIYCGKDARLHAKQASTGEQPDFACCLRCVSHELTRDVCGYAGQCVRQAITSSAATQPSPVAVDYTERARELLRKLHCWRLLYHNARPIDDPDVGQIAAALNEVASERDAAAIRAFGKRVWSDGEEVAYQAGVSDTRARLQESGVIEAVARAMCKRRNTKQCAAICLSHSSLVPSGECTETQIVWGEDADAALTKIAEMLK